MPIMEMTSGPSSRHANRPLCIYRGKEGDYYGTIDRPSVRPSSPAIHYHHLALESTRIWGLITRKYGSRPNGKEKVAWPAPCAMPRCVALHLPVREALQGGDRTGSTGGASVVQGGEGRWSGLQIRMRVNAGNGMFNPCSIFGPTLGVGEVNTKAVIDGQS
ncbi:hypothetical protein VTI74DRAFT_10359 [Chaetomium olivicolor]